MELSKKQRKYCTYKKDDLKLAIAAVNTHEMNITNASRFYKIPKTTLARKLENPLDIDARAGPAPYLSQEVETYLDYILKERAQCGLAVSMIDLRERVRLYVRQLKLKTPFRDDLPGRRWTTLFFQRHPKLVVKCAKSTVKGRILISEHDLREWNKALGCYLQDYLNDENDLQAFLSNPRRWFMLDESGFLLKNHKGRFVGLVCEPLWTADKESSFHEPITLLFSFNALGELPQPVVVYGMERFSKTMKESFPNDWLHETKSKSSMQGENLLAGIKSTVQWAKKNHIQFPIIIFINCHGNYIKLDTSIYCQQNGVILYALHVNGSHILVPQDMNVFQRLKEMWTEILGDKGIDKRTGKQISKYNVATLLHELVDRLPASFFVKSFKASGLFPLNPDNVDYNKVLTKNSHIDQPSDNSQQRETVNSQASKHPSSSSVAADYIDCSSFVETELQEIPHKQLELSNGAELVCDMEVETESETMTHETEVTATSTQQCRESGPAAAWGRHSLDMFLNGKHTDCTIIVESVPENTKVFQCHKFVLAKSSSVLERMVYTKVTCVSTIITEADVHPKTFHQFLLYLYSGEVSLHKYSFKEVCELCKAADKYKVEELCKLCLKHMLAVMTPAACTTAFHYANLLSLTRLKNKAKMMLQVSTQEILQASSFVEADHSFVLFMVQQNNLNINSEADLIDGCLRWAEREVVHQELPNDTAGLRKVLGPIFKYLRFRALSLCEMMQGPAKSELLTAVENSEIVHELVSKSTKSSGLENICEDKNSRGRFKYKKRSLTVSTELNNMTHTADCISAEICTCDATVTELLASMQFRVPPPSLSSSSSSSCELYMKGFTLSANVGLNPNIMLSGVQMECVHRTCVASNLHYYELCRPVLLEGDHTYEMVIRALCNEEAGVANSLHQKDLLENLCGNDKSYQNVPPLSFITSIIYSF